MPASSLAIYVLKRAKKLVYFVILMLSFFVPLFFAESYLFGLFMPFQWFIYYLTPPLAIFAAVSLVFVADKFSIFYAKNKASLRRNRLKIVTITLVVLMSLMLVFVQMSCMEKS